MVINVSNDLVSSNPLEGTYEEQENEEVKGIIIQIGIEIPEILYNIGI